MSLFKNIPLHINYPEAIQMDDLYTSNKSLKKQIESFSILKEESFLPEQIQYYIQLILEPLLENKDYKSVNKIISQLDINTSCFQVLRVLLILLKPTIQHYQDYPKFFMNCKALFDKDSIDINKILTEVNL